MYLYITCFGFFTLYVGFMSQKHHVCGLTEALPVGLDLWSQAAYFPLELLLGLLQQVTVLGHDFSF